MSRLNVNLKIWLAFKNFKDKNYKILDWSQKLGKQESWALLTFFID